jgi:hypothetical protein
MTTDSTQVVYERATVLLQALQPWASHGEKVKDAAVALTLALARVGAA